MAKKSKSRKKTSKVSQLPRHQRYTHVLHLLKKYYGYGGRKRFSDYKELRNTASLIHKKIVVKEGGKATLKTVRNEIKRIKPYVRGKSKKEQGIPPQIFSSLKPVLPYFYLCPRPEGDETYSVLTGIFSSPNTIRFVSPMILGKKTLKAGGMYGYEETFSDFVDYMNSLDNDREIYEQLAIRFLYDDMIQQKDGIWDCELISCNEEGLRTDFGYNPYKPRFSKPQNIPEEKITKEPEAEKPEEVKEPTETISAIDKEKIKQTRIDTITKLKDDIRKDALFYKEMGENEMAKSKMQELKEMDIKLKSIT